jgi:hemerythrin superfamily protein
MNAIELLKKDHHKVAGLFKQYESAGEDAPERKEELFRRIKRELDIHARIEEEIFYPAAKQVRDEEARELVAEAAEEHKQIKTLLAELDGMDAEDEQFDAKMKVLEKDVEHHVEEEENDLFPKVKKGLGRDRLEDLGRQLEYRRQSLAAAGSVEDKDDEEDDEDDEATEEAGAGRAAGPRTRDSGSSADARRASSMAGRGSSSSDARDDASSGSVGGSRPGSMGGSRSGPMGRSGSASRSRSGSASRSRPTSGGRSRGRSRAGSRSRSRSGGSRSSRGRSR